MAKQIADRDTSVRNAALNAITETYFQEGEKLYKMIGNLPEKASIVKCDKSLSLLSSTGHGNARGEDQESQQDKAGGES